VIADHPKGAAEAAPINTTHRIPRLKAGATDVSALRAGQREGERGRSTANRRFLPS